MNYARAIRIARAIRDMPQRELAKKTGYDPSYISLIETDRRTPSTTAMEKIAKATGFPMSLLVILATPKEQFDRLDEETLRIMGGWFLKVLMGTHVASGI